MKVKLAMLISLTVLILISLGYPSGLAQTNHEKAGCNIGVLSIRKVFTECKRNAAYREEAEKEQQRIASELEKLSKEIDAARAGLDTLKPGSSDHVKQLEELMEKQAKFEAQQEFQKHYLTLKDQRWTTQLYQEILKVIPEIAKEKGLDVVIEDSDVDLEDASANELMLTIRTHKLLYSDGCVDLTDEVIDKLDKAD